MRYSILLLLVVIACAQQKTDQNVSAPMVVATYPSCDTVPSNLLKVYFRFSEPMQEYRSSQFIRLIDNTTGDTIKDAFLDLKPELWNEDETVLTLWLDPGRIKQDLVPNRELGTVLKDHKTYRLEVSKGWKSKKGVTSASNYMRTFFTVSRDVTQPTVDTWTVAATKGRIVVNTNETIDWMLLNNRVSVWSGDRLIEAETFSEVCERQLIIIPKKPLERGNYSVVVEETLEDLAGNNLNRLFETDVTAPSKKSVNKQDHRLTFTIN